MSVTRTTTVASIKEEIMKMYDYSSPKEFDLLYNGIALAGSNIEKHKIAENSTLIVTERIGKNGTCTHYDLVHCYPREELYT